MNVGKKYYCLEKPGEYQFTLESCHVYDSKVISYKTDTELNEVMLKALKHSLKLSIKSDPGFGNLKVSIKIGTEKSEKTLLYSDGKYELTVILEPGESAVIVPLSDILFFNPPILSVEGKNDCADLGIKFVAIKGRVFQGKVKPPLAGVTVTVESSDSETLVVDTDANGHFKFPPLDDSKNYKIYATKPSYVLTGPDSEGNFLAHKLAEVIVDVVDVSDNSPLTVSNFLYCKFVKVIQVKYVLK